MTSTIDITNTPSEGSEVPVKPMKTSLHSEVDGPYAKYVLMVLVLVYVLNFLDRQILSILAEEIKADLGLTDADMGFLAGTAFIAFYTILGIPLARLADVWNRKKLISIGLGFWSLMTALSGTARAFLPLAACRFGIAAGEASATPAIASILYDYFSPRLRTTVLAIYGSGAPIGAGLGLFLGGTIADAWNGTFPDSALAPLGLRGWQVAFFSVGLPGILMALWVSTLREPVRGQSDNIVTQEHPTPFREAFTVLISLLPGSSLWVLKQGSTNNRAVFINLLGAVIIFLVSYGLVSFTGDVLQWTIVGFGVYAVISWLQSLALRDPVAFALILKCKTILCLGFGGGIQLFLGVALGFWMIPFIQRTYDVNPADVGLVLGSGNVLMGLSGVILGGILADKLRARSGKGKLYVLLLSTAGSTLAILIALLTDHLTVLYAAFWLAILFGSMAYGPGNSTINDLVLPRVRATAIAFYFLLTSFIGGALGPYFIGFLSDSLMLMGATESEALRQSMLWSLLAPLIGMVLVIMALKHVEADESSVLERARALGEGV